MALIRCTECGKEISSKAKACPHCGCPVELQENPSAVGSPADFSPDKATEMMQSEIARAKLEMREAESNFDLREGQLRSMASKSINLHSNTAASEAVEIAATAKDMCDELYITYQSLVQRIDAVCRPLLSFHPDASVIKETAEQIEHMNEESKISASFTASLNQTSLGNFAASQYLPSMECRMIEAFWKDAYRNTPEYLQEKQMEEQRRLEEVREKKTLAEKVRAERIAYRSDYEKWKNETDVQEARRAAELSERLEAERKRIDLETRQRCEAHKREQEALIADKTMQKEKAEAALTEIGVFQFAEKKAQKQKIAILKQELEAAKTDLRQTDTLLRKELDEIPLRIKEKEPEFRKEIEENYPIPPEPKKPDFMTAASTASTQEVNEGIRQSILEILSDGKAHKSADLMEEPLLREFSSQRISSILKMMRDHGEIKREEINHLAYYSLQ